MRDRIWAELTQSKHSLEFSALYCNRQRAYIRYFNMGVLIFSTGGIMGWKLWDGLPFIACIIISLVSILRLIQPHIIMNDKLLINLDNIHEFYIDYYNKLEKLWYDYEGGKFSHEEAHSKFFELKDSETAKSQIIRDTIRSQPKNLVDKAKVYSDQYFKQVFNTSSHE
jgi:hypothetical protein